ncbi:MAG TPA: Smr/MutS family protein [Gemmatimonadales bacterium]|nr:Smr/MutS family protein [Gemmatimonadales bacterium]
MPTGAGTPSVLPPEHCAAALAALEFPAALDAVATFAAGPLGAHRIRSRRPSADLAAVREALAAVEEVAALERSGRGLAISAAPDAAPALSRLRREGSVLEGSELALVARLLEAGRRTSDEIGRVALEAPRAARLAVPLPTPELDRRLARSIDADGAVLDTASPALAEARREVQGARAKLVKRLEALLRGAEGAPDEAAITLRNGRYVIPVRRDSRKRPDGIVHDESASGTTLFIEPAETIPLGNALREAEVAEEREVRRVLAELSALLRPWAPSLAGVQEMCIAVDDLAARGRYAARCDAVAPEIGGPGSVLVIRHGRHPILLARGIAVVPFDLVLERGERTVLVSGPNTGGKTVFLKAVGLLSALAQSGIVPPLAAGSSLPLFRQFHADIGDHQSIAADLSTFSAHVAEVRRILDGADDATLVLFDEIGSGTDPAEGAALAAATLTALTARGVTTIATTHLGALKDLATRIGGVVNASLQFDVAALAPTYRFQKGVPGRSYGLAIARRLGVDAAVLAAAEALVSTEERRLDQLLAAAEAKGAELDRRARELDDRALDAGNVAARLAAQETSQAEREAALAAREKEAEREKRSRSRDFLLEARQTVEDALALARKAATEEDAREARRKLEAAAGAEREGLERLEGSEEGRVKREKGRGRREEGRGKGEAHEGREVFTAGDLVQTAGGVSGEVIVVRRDGKVVVAAGAIRLTVDAAELARVPRLPTRDSRPATRATRPATHDPRPTTHDHEIDLRGMTGDEAEMVTAAAVDAAVLGEAPFLRIIHGMGTGVVRERVQRVLKADKRVKTFAFAPRNQGGTGVTVAEFAT